MNKILDELGYPRSRRFQVYLVILFAAATLFFLVLGEVLLNVLGITPIILQVLVWVGWFIWQGHFFAKNRDRYLYANPTIAYRMAFRQDILPGVALGVSQMLRPPLHGYLTSPHFNDSPWIAVVCAVFVAIGTGLLYMGFRTIGFDGAGFLYEYKTHSAPLTQKSIYAFIRHPLFLGGVLISVGASLLSGNTETLVMVAINVLILPIYSHLEDARLVHIFGTHYREYKLRVGGLFPRFESLMRFRDTIDINPGHDRTETNQGL